MKWHIANEGRTSVSYPVLATLRTLFQNNRGKWWKALGRIMLLTVVFWFRNKSLSLETTWVRSFKMVVTWEARVFCQVLKRWVPVHPYYWKIPYITEISSGWERSWRLAQWPVQQNLPRLLAPGPFGGRRDEGTPGSRFCMDTSPLCEDSIRMTLSPPEAPPHYTVTSRHKWKGFQ